MKYQEHMDAAKQEELAGRSYPDEDPFDEFAAEVAPSGVGLNRRLNLPEEDRPDIVSGREFRGNGQAVEKQANAGLGWTAVIVAFISLFLWPSILGAAAVVLGIFAWLQGQRAKGLWSIVMGSLALLAYWVLVPYYA